MNERRDAERYSMKLPVSLRLGEKKVPAFTSNLSARGVLLESESDLQNEALTFEMTFPPELTLSTSLLVRCEAKVVRVIDDQPQHKAVAVRIYRYEFLTDLGEREVA
jgi:hypothetical protein